MSDKADLKHKVLSGLFWKFGERISAQLVSTIVSIILARLLDPEHYGIVALVFVFINIANVFVTSSFGNALVQKKDVDNVDFSSVFFLNAGLSILIYIILFIMAPFIAAFYNMSLLTPVIRVLSLRIPVAAVNSIQQAYVSRNMMFKRFFWATLFGTVVSGVIGVLLANKGVGVWALVTQYLLNTCIDTVFLWITVKWRPELKFSWQRAKGLLSYGWKLLVSALISTGYGELRSLVIGKKYTSSDLAFFNQGDKYPKLIVNNVNVSISGVLFPAMAQVQDDRVRVKKMTRTAIQVSSFVMWPLMVGLAVTAESFVRILLTDKWLPCVPYIRIFCFTYGLWPIHTSNLESIKAMGRSDLYLKLEISKKLVGITSLVAAIPFGPLAIAYSLIVSDVLSALINAYPNIKLLNYKYSEQIKDLFPPLIIAGVMAAVIYPIKFLNFGDWTTLSLQVVTGAVVYVVLSMVTKQLAFRYLLGFIKQKK